jgi:ferritin-like metal-binding protein YciE
METTIKTLEPNIKAPALKKPAPAVPGKLNTRSPLQLFFTNALKDIYWAERELIGALPGMISSATTEELKTAIEEHLIETETHVVRIEEVFEILGEPREAKTCYAMEGILKEADSIVQETEEGSITRDAAIIMAAQKVEHYEIATYGSLVEYAKTLGYNDIHGILQLTFDEERMADQGLTLIAQNKINWEAEINDK